MKFGKNLFFLKIKNVDFLRILDLRNQQKIIELFLNQKKIIIEEHLEYFSKLKQNSFFNLKCAINIKKENNLKDLKLHYPKVGTSKNLENIIKKKVIKNYTKLLSQLKILKSVKLFTTKVDQTMFKKCWWYVIGEK